ncbi:helix-turn-helix domain-containing protein [Dawidia soli]|uniref:Helix-turn-helix domain-containing protein n=1 Tax=Dawidia soli TaxID=2782352 RepID=A0AAP2DBV2_9BACT|nr:helix-turn-helix transcriptional regulator [Dawidia soli]MBT1688869.1 helix-turn-helix domain-containing protein [Dawidia soli]
MVINVLNFLTHKRKWTVFLNIYLKIGYDYGKLNDTMTKLGEFLEKKAVVKAEIARRTGITKNRMTDITVDPNVALRADEVWLIARAIDVEPADLLEHVCGHLKLQA